MKMLKLLSVLLLFAVAIVALGTEELKIEDTAPNESIKATAVVGAKQYHIETRRNGDDRNGGYSILIKDDNGAHLAHIYHGDVVKEWEEEDDNYVGDYDLQAGHASAMSRQVLDASAHFKENGLQQEHDALMFVLKDLEDTAQMFQDAKEEKTVVIQEKDEDEVPGEEDDELDNSDSESELIYRDDDSSSSSSSSSEEEDEDKDTASNCIRTYLGRCLNTRRSNCPGGIFTKGVCPGPSYVQCCHKGLTRCKTQKGGNCIDTSKYKCSGVLYTGYCPGNKYMKCCKKSSSSGSGTSGSSSAKIVGPAPKEDLVLAFNGYKDGLWGVFNGIHHSSTIIAFLKRKRNKCDIRSKTCPLTWSAAKAKKYLCNHGRCPWASGMKSYCYFRGGGRALSATPYYYNCRGEYDAVCYSWESDGHNCNDDTLYQMRIVYYPARYRNPHKKGECVGRCSSSAPHCVKSSSRSLPTKVYF